MTDRDWDEERLEIEAELVRETDKVYLLQVYNAGVLFEKWVPKSQVVRLALELWEMPEWLAKDKEFV